MMGRRRGRTPNYTEKVDNPEVDELLGGPDEGAVENEPPEEHEGPVADAEEDARDTREVDDRYGGDGAQADAGEDDGEVKHESRAQRRIRQILEREKEKDERIQQLEGVVQSFSGLKEEIEQWQAQQAQTQQSEPKPKEPELPAPPDYLDQEVKDYFGKLQGYITSREQQYQQEIERLSGGVDRYSQQSEQAQQIQQMVSRAQAMEQDFTSKAPDYYDALNYVRELQRKSLMEDYGLQRHDADAQIQQDEMQRVAAAFTAGKNVAELTYNMAKRFGFKGNARQTGSANPAQDKRKASVNMGGSPRVSLDDFKNKDKDEFDEALDELMSVIKEGRP